MRVRPLALFVLLALGVLGLVWRFASDSDSGTSVPLAPVTTSTTAAAPSPPAASAADLASLAADLAAERAARRALADEVASMRAELERRPGGGGAAGSAAAPALPPGHAVVAPDAVAATDFDTRALVDAGFDEREAQQLRARTEELELERLYLRDRAVREGWAGTPRFMEESRALDAKGRGLRDELGDDRYDWLLFASGQSNRVVVQSVMERSPAAGAGIRPGDAIVSYGDTRLFDAASLRDATTQGKPAETVPVEIVRDGETQRVFVARGPLGVRLDEARLRPANPVRR